jgi:hypothetical protein
MKVSFRLVDDPKKQLNFYQSIVIKICKVFIGKHIFLHKIDQIYVNIETGKITMMIDGEQENVLSSNFNSERKNLNCLLKFVMNFIFQNSFMINQMDFVSIRKIINKTKNAENVELTDVKTM